MADWTIYDANGKTVRSFHGTIQEYKKSNWFQDDLHRNFQTPFTAIRWPDDHRVTIHEAQHDLFGGVA